MTKPKALLIGFNPDLMQALPFLLFRAGFEIDVVTPKDFFKNSCFVSRRICFEEQEFLPAKLDELELEAYQLIVPADDLVLKTILESDLALAKKLKLLPVVSEKNFAHIGSKIVLSQILREAKINTPQFFCVQDCEQALAAAQQIGFPVMLKVDFSGGGLGVFECRNSGDIEELVKKNLKFPLKFPLLVQKKILGTEVDLSAFYQNKRLIHFSYAEPKKMVSKFGPSFLRIYRQLATIESCEELFSEMQQLGEALGANGFVNISAIKSESDGKFYFIEADMRPNVWADFTRFVGDDLAVKISNWFLQREVSGFPFVTRNDFPLEKRLAHFLRVSILSLVFNRYGLWKILSSNELKWLLSNVLCRKICLFFWQLNRIPTLLIRKIMPNKESRKMVKKKLRLVFLRVFSPVFLRTVFASLK